jgi:hypothetical protein
MALTMTTVIKTNYLHWGRHHDDWHHMKYSDKWVIIIRTRSIAY